MTTNSCQDLPDGFIDVPIYNLYFMDGTLNHAVLKADKKTIICYLYNQWAGENEAIVPTFDGKPFNCGSKTWKCEFNEYVAETDR